MATETVPHMALEGQLDVDLSYEVEPDSIPAADWQSSELAPGTHAKMDSAGALSSTQPAVGDGLSEIDWEDNEDVGSGEAQAVNAEITEIGDPQNPTFPESDLTGPNVDLGLDLKPITEEVDVGDPIDLEGQEEELDMSGDFAEMDGFQGANDQQLATETFVEHEITYDEDSGVTHEVQKHVEAGISTHEAAAEASDGHGEIDPGANAEVQQQENEKPEEDTPLEITEETGNEDANSQHDEEHGDPVVEVISDDEDSGDDHSAAADAVIPDITVTYRNEEFPLVHGQNNIDTQMGFFEDFSVLELTVDQLIGKFRDELAGDLGPQDEIVLQVDELGLEYAESTQRDHLTGVTLRQLHEIFDQLVKNQDPDVTRTLYTNIIVRPHPAKRLELLIDEAFDGKGLDEIIYHFQATDDHLDSHGGSAEDVIYVESSDGEEEGAVDAGATSPDGEAASDHQDDEQGEASRDPSVEYLDVDADDDDYGNAEPEYAPEANDDDNTGTYPDDSANDQFPEEREAGDAGIIVGENQSIAEEVEATTQNDHKTDNYGSEQSAGAIVGDADNSGFDFVDLTEGEEEAQPDIPDMQYAESSASATLDGDRENEIDYDENDIADSANPEPQQAQAEGDPVNEIDWRDFPEEGDSGVQEPVSVSAKRPHSEVDDGEEFDLDTENGFKRRRSS